MENKKIKVGIIGGSIRNRWASTTHIPALIKSKHHQITAIATTNMESAKESANQIGEIEAYDNYKEMLTSKNVDMIIVSVKAPFHKEIVLNTIRANKHIYCEWPLAIGTSEVESIMKEMDQSTIKHAIGLQSRQADEVKLVKDIVDSNEIGSILSINMKVSTHAKGNWVDKAGSYILDRKNGATLLTINGGHALDVLTFIFGHFSEVQANHHTHYTKARILDNDSTINKNIEDQYLISGKINNYIPIVVHLQGGAYPQFFLEIQGERGIIRLYQNQSIGHPQYGGLSVSLAKYDSTQTITTSQNSDFTVLMEDNKEVPFTNVCRAHQSFAKDILLNTNEAPDFHYASYLHRLITAIEVSAETGEKISIE